MKQNISILVWDQDDPLTLKDVIEAMQTYESVAAACWSAEEVFFAIQHKAVDVVILNLQQPCENALHLLSEIKNQASHVEVIFVSSFDEETRCLWTEVIQRGAYEFLPKPLDLLELESVLVQAIEKHHAVKHRKRPPAASLVDLQARRRNASASGN
jgi:DNA-binding NtrC family response regulator